jgi:hypothetical protein
LRQNARENVLNELLKTRKPEKKSPFTGKKKKGKQQRFLRRNSLSDHPSSWFILYGLSLRSFSTLSSSDSADDNDYISFSSFFVVMFVHKEQKVSSSST